MKRIFYTYGFQYGLIGILLGIMVILQSPVSFAEEKPRLAVLPFFVGKEASCPVCSTVFKRGEVLSHGAHLMTRLLHQKIGAIETFTLLPLEKGEEALSLLEGRESLSSLIELGREMRADFIFVGFLFRFEERVGSSMGVERPASLAFDLHLFRTKDSKEVWRGRMDETQRPLSENLFQIGSFLRRKARWLTAEELASVGLDEVLGRLPKRKDLEEKR